MKKMIACGIVTLALLTGCGATPTKLDPNAPAAPATPGTPAPKAPEVFKIGDRVKMGDQVLTVIGGRVLPPGQFLKPKEGTIWLALECLIENAGADKTVVSSIMQFKVTDGEGYRHNPTFAEADTKGNLDGDVTVGGKMRGEVVFEVPRNAKGLQLQFIAGMGDDPAIINLGEIITPQ